jgi:hypothetical protein
MPRSRFSGSLTTPKVDVAIDMGNPLLNLTVDGFLKIGTVRIFFILYIYIIFLGIYYSIFEITMLMIQNDFVSSLGSGRSYQSRCRGCLSRS